MGKQDIKTIFDVKIETGDGSNGYESVIVEPNPDQENVMSVFLVSKDKPPRQYYNMRICNNGEFVLVVEGDKRTKFIKFEGDKFRYSIYTKPRIEGNYVILGIAAFLDFSFSKLKIEARHTDILFELTT